jgi:hypothetical protein
MSEASEEKMGEKFKTALVFGGAVMAAGVLLLAFGVRSDTVLIAWLATLAAIPTQFSIANASITRKFAEVNAGGA